MTNHYYYNYAPPAAVPVKPKTNGYAQAGGVIGIVNISSSFLLSWFIPYIYVVISIVSIVLSVVGLKQARQYEQPEGMAITGIATSLPTLAWSLFWSYWLTLALTDNLPPVT